MCLQHLQYVVFVRSVWTYNYSLNTMAEPAKCILCIIEALVMELYCINYSLTKHPCCIIKIVSWGESSDFVQRKIQKERNIISKRYVDYSSVLPFSVSYQPNCN